MIDSIPDFLLLGGVLIGGAVSFHQIKNRGSLFFSVFKTGDPEEKNPHPCTVIATLGGCFLLGIFLAYFWSTELSSLLLRFDLLFGSLSNSAGSFGIWGPVLVFGGIFLMGIGMRYFGERPSPETSRREGYMWKQEKIYDDDDFIDARRRPYLT